MTSFTAKALLTLIEVVERLGPGHPDQERLRDLRTEVLVEMKKVQMMPAKGQLGSR